MKRSAGVQIKRLGHVFLVVSDIARAKDFYTRVLGFELIEEEHDHGGVFMALKEQRDSEVEGIIAEGHALSSSQTIASPSGTDSVGNSHAVALLDDGSFGCLSQQSYPTAVSAFADVPGGSYTIGFAGLDAACAPETACMGAATGEYFVAGYPYSSYLTVNRFLKGTPETQHEEYFTDTALARLVHNSSSGDIRLFYAANSSQDVYSRLWNGSSWGAAEQAYNGSVAIEALAAAASPSGQWSLLVLDSSDALSLMETTMGVWGSADVLSTDAANGAAGVGLATDEYGNSVAALELQGAAPGVYVSTRAVGFSFGSFALAAATTGTQARCINATMTLGYPDVFFYELNAIENLSKLKICEPGGGGWTCVAVPEQIHGSPYGLAMDSNGNVIVSGHELTSMPYEAVAVVFFAN